VGLAALERELPIRTVRSTFHQVEVPDDPFQSLAAPQPVNQGRFIASKDSLLRLSTEEPLEGSFLRSKYVRPRVLERPIMSRAENGERKCRRRQQERGPASERHPEGVAQRILIPRIRHEQPQPSYIVPIHQS